MVCIYHGYVWEETNVSTKRFSTVCGGCFSLLVFNIVRSALSGTPPQPRGIWSFKYWVEPKRRWSLIREAPTPKKKQRTCTNVLRKRICGSLEGRKLTRFPREGCEFQRGRLFRPSGRRRAGRRAILLSGEGIPTCKVDEGNIFQE